jgi:hypothetical protein
MLNSEIISMTDSTGLIFLTVSTSAAALQMIWDWEKQFRSLRLFCLRGKTGHTTNLIVVPTSSLFNWQEEISRFALPSKFCFIMEQTDLKQLLICLNMKLF